MILEVAILTVHATQANDFEIAFQKAHTILADMDGYVSHQLQKCIERDDRYLLLVQWQNVESHTIGFR